MKIKIFLLVCTALISVMILQKELAVSGWLQTSLIFVSHLSGMYILMSWFEKSKVNLKQEYISVVLKKISYVVLIFSVAVNNLIDMYKVPVSFDKRTILTSILTLLGFIAIAFIVADSMHYMNAYKEIKSFDTTKK